MSANHAVLSAISHVCQRLSHMRHSTSSNSTEYRPIYVIDNNDARSGGHGQLHVNSKEISKCGRRVRPTRYVPAGR